eukprot:5564835-Prymnesium_polylepis.1
MSRQQEVVRVWTRASGTARLRRADRRGAACGRAAHADIARRAADRGPALRHSCFFVFGNVVIRRGLASQGKYSSTAK